ncbi:ATP-dependent helicase [Megasphaera stantonii]|nr:ATP-dependent helicase [Megasphaera stantonii]
MYPIPKEQSASSYPHLHVVPSAAEAFLFPLNEEQRAAVQAIHGVQCIQAGAGTGKSACIIAKLQYIQHTDPDAHTLLVISFTRKAVEEIKQRLPTEHHISVMTFHSLFYHILRNHGYQGYSLLSASQQKRLAQFILQNLQLHETLTTEDALHTLHAVTVSGNLAVFRKAYVQQQHTYHVMDFDSMQLFCYQLLKEHPELRRHYQNLFRYILVDEFQDINPIQWAILKQLAPKRKSTNLTVVGDPRQSIYRFRGATPDILTDFCSFYGDAVHCVTLMKNYRNTPSILALGNRLTPGYEPLVPVRQQKEYPAPVYYAAATDTAEADFVVNHIKALYQSGIPYAGMAVLYRSSAAAHCLVNRLYTSSIPVVQRNGRFLYDRPVYRTLFSLLRAGMNLASSMDWKHILHAMGGNDDIWRMLNRRHADTGEDRLALLPSFIPDESMRDTALQLVSILEASQSVPLKNTVLQLWKTLLCQQFTNDDSVLDTVLSQTEPFRTPQELLKHVSILQKQRRHMEQLAATPDADYVSALSIHSAKGMEFRVVFLIGAADGILPDTSHDTADLEEERRLAYVAVTRAQERLYISYAKKTGHTAHQPSRFFGKLF